MQSYNFILRMGMLWVSRKGFVILTEVNPYFVENERTECICNNSQVRLCC